MDPNTRALMMGAAGAGGAEKLYVEDVFQTWLYTGNGSTQTITNGIDLSGKGGLVWIKGRTANTYGTNHVLFDSERGPTFRLFSNSTSAQGNNGSASFSSTGFNLPSGDLTYSTENYASWTFRKAAKFFDVVTYTGNGTARTITHNLGSVPGCIIVKSTSQADNWKVYHRSLTSNAYYILLDSTAAQSNAVDLWNSTTPTSTEFSIGSSSNINTNGATYVAYLFAHDAGGFGDSGNDSVVSCGSFIPDGSGNATVNLGWEPQWILIKDTTGVDVWRMFDTMRGMPVTGSFNWLRANASDAEASSSVGPRPTATGFQAVNFSSGSTYIYIAIRRGPMKTPTDATKVFSATAGTDNAPYSVGFPTDLAIIGYRNGNANYTQSVGTRLTGNSANLFTSKTNAEDTSQGQTWSFDLQNSFDQNWISPAARWNFRRAPGFFDVVAYTGTGAAQTVSHNLGVVPELLIIKGRNQSTNWKTYYSFTSTTYKDFNLNGTSAASNGTYGPGGSPNFESFSTAPTATSFSVSANSVVINNSGTNYIAYLFATVTAVSKVGTYTGTGTTLNIDCGFTAGARFVLIKRTDSSGDWYVWDTARGIVSGNDPYLLLNSSAAEDTSTDYIDPLNAGFQISSTAPAAINANGGSFIFLAVA